MVFSDGSLGEDSQDPASKAVFFWANSELWEQNPAWYQHSKEMFSRVPGR